MTTIQEAVSNHLHSAVLNLLAHVDTAGGSVELENLAGDLTKAIRLVDGMLAFVEKQELQLTEH